MQTFLQLLVMKITMISMRFLTLKRIQKSRSQDEKHLLIFLKMSFTVKKEQKNTYRNSDNVTQCVQTQKEKNAHSKFFNKFLNMMNRNTQISIKENVSSAYSD